MDQNQVWAALKARYFAAWLTTDPETWPDIRRKLDMVGELREEMRKMANAGEIDNAGSPSAE